MAHVIAKRIALAVRWMSIATSIVAAGCSGAGAGDDLLLERSSGEQAPTASAPVSEGADPSSAGGTSNAQGPSERQFVSSALRFGGSGYSTPPPSIGSDPSHPGGSLPSTPPTEAEWFAPAYAWGPGLAIGAPVAPVFWPVWNFAGTLAYSGGTQGFVVPLGVSFTTHFIIEAPASCAPTLTQASAWVSGSHIPVTLSFAGQRWVGGYLQALLRVGTGVTVALSEVDFVFASSFFVSCPIGVYVVRII